MAQAARCTFIVVCAIICAFANAALIINSQEAQDFNEVISPVHNVPWLGSDVASSQWLYGNTYMWMWGDTLVGNLTYNGTSWNRQWRDFPRNAISIAQVHPENQTFTITPYIRSFKADPNPPVPQTVYGFFTLPPGHPERNTSWLWCFRGETINDNLFIRCGLVAVCASCPLGFNETGDVFVRVTNPTHPDPFQWTYTVTGIPTQQTTETISWGSTAWTQNTLYMWGTEGTGLGVRQVICRLNGTYLLADDYSKIELYTASNTWVLLSSRTDAGPQAKVMMYYSTGTSQWNEYLNKWMYIALFPFDYQVKMWTADEITGPWEGPDLVYEIDSKYHYRMVGDEMIWAYSIEWHPELAFGEEDLLVWSFATNGPIFDGIDFYVPHIVRSRVTVSSTTSTADATATASAQASTAFASAVRVALATTHAATTSATTTAAATTSQAVTTTAHATTTTARATTQASTTFISAVRVALATTQAAATSTAAAAASTAAASTAALTSATTSSETSTSTSTSDTSTTRPSTSGSTAATPTSISILFAALLSVIVVFSS